jgi:TRAP-type C4-dicarboxylate transport system substrate-binding protein
MLDQTLGGRCAALATVLALTSAGSLAAQEFRWDMPNEYGETTTVAQSDQVFSALLHERSDGRIQITHHFGGSLGLRSIDHWASVEDGAVPLASTFAGVLTGIDPIFFLNAMPFLATNPMESQTLIDAAREEYARAFEESGQILLMTEPWVPVGIWADRLIETPEDLEGLRIRTSDRNGSLIMEAVGANPTQMTWGDVVPALATNTIDSVLTSGVPGLQSNFQDYLDHFHDVGFVLTTNMVHMNRDVFDSLPEDLQQIVLDTAAEAEAQVWADAAEALGMTPPMFEAAGVTLVSDFSPELMAVLREAASPVLEEWRASMPEGVADRILARYEELLAERRQ